MDPNACYRRWLLYLVAGELDEARQAWADLWRWIGEGGFEPDWDPKQRREWMAWRVNFPGQPEVYS